MDTSILTRLLEAASTGESFEATGVDSTDENLEMFERLIGEINDVQERVMVSPELEWPDDTFDDLIDSTYAAWGAPRTLEQLQAAEKAEKATLVSKAVPERMFTLGPMYIPNMKDAHAEWTDPEELQKAVWEYVRKDDRRIYLQHDRRKVAGEWVAIMTWPYDVDAPIVMKDATEGSLRFPANTVFLGVQWKPWAWELVKDGKLRGYSIGGRAERLSADLPEDAVGKSLAPFDEATMLRAEDIDELDLGEQIARAVADAVKSIQPVVNVVVPEDKPRVRRVERDEHGNIARIVEE